MLLAGDKKWSTQAARPIMSEQGFKSNRKPCQSNAGRPTSLHLYYGANTSIVSGGGEKFDEAAANSALDGAAKCK